MDGIRTFAQQDSNYKRILVVKNTERIKSYIKAMKNESGEPFDKVVKNVEYKTAKQLAEAVFFYKQSVEDSDPRIVISDMESTIILKKILMEMLEAGECQYFKDKNLISLNMARELYSVLDAIGRNGWNDIKEDGSDRIQDLKLLEARYQKYLTDNGLMDSTLLIKESLAYINTLNDKDTMEEICGGTVNGLYDDSEDMTNLEIDFIETLIRKTGGDVICISDKNSISDLELSQDEVKFFKGYGSMNEASYVVNDILKNKYPLGDVKVIYTSADKENFIEAAFKGNGIPVNFTSSISLAHNSVVDLCRKILAWAKDNYSETALEQIMRNNALYVEGFYKKEEEKELLEDIDTGENADDVTEEDEESVYEELSSQELERKEEREKLEKLGYASYNYIGGKRYFQHILAPKSRRDVNYHLGWGYERNCQFLDSEDEFLDEEYKKLIEELKAEGKLDQEGINAKVRYDAKKKVLKLHRMLINIFAEGQSKEIEPGKIYKGLIDFVKEFGKKKSKDYRLAKAYLDKASVFLAQEGAMDLVAALDYIDQVLASLTYNQKETYDQVTAERFSSWVNLDREYIYFIGMSMKDLQANAAESPIMRDCDWDRYVKGEYKPTVLGRSRQQIQDFYRSLKTFSGKSISFGYADFDVAAFGESGPSTIFRELLGKFSREAVKDLPEFVYGKAEGFEEVDTEDYLNHKAEIFVDERTSNSILEKLVACPKQYGCMRRLNVDDEKPLEKYRPYVKWLDAAQKGTFFHNVAEKYVKAALILDRSHDVPLELNEKCLEDIIDEEKEATMKVIPYVALGDVEDEVEDIRKAAVAYFIELHKKLHATGDEFGWRILDAELKFEDMKYSVTSYKDTSYDLLFKGFIDRIDYRRVDVAKLIQIRVVDYKTGRCASKEEEISVGGLTQHIIYKAAIKAITDNKKIYDMIAGLEKDETIRDYSIEFVSFTYMFPMDSCLEIVIPSDEIEGVNLSRIKSALTAMEDMEAYPDKVDLFEKIKEYAGEYAAKDPNVCVLLDNISKKDRSTKEIKGMKDKYKAGCDYCGYKEFCLKRKAGEV